MASEALAAVQTTPLRRVILSSLIGTTIEWYDFFLYGYASALAYVMVIVASLALALLVRKAALRREDAS